MKNFITKILLVSVFSLMPIVSQAAAAWTGWYPVNQVYTYSTGAVFIGLNPSSAHSNPDGCVSSSWLLTPHDQANVKEIYQMALTAQAAGLKINAYVSGCAGNYPQIHHLRSN